ncbi:UDP-N-acetylglucosamine 2-epimerase (non-hydrolyzing) [Pseudoalteromonas sp. CO325X]|uniref:non-hydrolyzing UDP-N-acetylglucosamine 2-epimerase n=1 Tax=Pseudoalteromonas sp. CO325X TaxID=1777262 RepID=UPI001981062C|nr:UDP-N-acetylglucosamine 2-epimerase (non-hydrolyzing) [Pseudoalteromonas sp. CO325X]
MIRISTVIGARPQFIKAAVVSRAIKCFSDMHEEIIHTGQHYDENMSDVFFDELDIPKPTHNLKVNGGGHGRMTGQMMEKLEELWLETPPDMVLVYGDTNSTLAAALVAAKLHIPLVHVEAGLRSFNKKMPEEINRLLTDHVGELLLCPTPRAVELLSHEGIADKRVHHVGDVMFDAVQFYKEKAMDVELPCSIDDYVLCTLHRAENTSSKERLIEIINGLKSINHKVLLPLHPRTKATFAELEITLPENIQVVPPMSYLQMIKALSGCEFVVTDSGGLQKEAYFMGKMCITTRDETEWQELVDSGVNKLVGASAEKIKVAVEEVSSISTLPTLDSYGSGKAGEEIVRLIRNHAQ